MSVHVIFNTVRNHFLCSYALYCTFLCLCPLLLSETVAESRPICLPSHSVITDRSGRLSSIPPAASYFTTLKSTVDLDGRFLCFTRSRVLFHVRAATAVCRSTWCSGLPLTRLSGPSHYPRAPKCDLL